MRFWPLSRTMCPMMGNLVRLFFNSSTHQLGTIFTPYRGASYRFPWTYWGAFGWEYGRGRLANDGTVWSHREGMLPTISMGFANMFTDHRYRYGQCQQRGISFSAQDARMQCMPHTIHLAAIKVSSLAILNHYSLYLIVCLLCLAPRRDWSDIKGGQQESNRAKW